MDVALFALFRTKAANFKPLKKELSCLRVQSSNREEPVFDAFDAHALSSYIKMRANVFNEQEEGIQRSPSEASLLFQYPENYQRLVYGSKSLIPVPQRSVLKSSIRRGLMMLPGNILLMKAAQSGRSRQIGFGVKTTVGQRPYMEDSHITKPFFIRFPISLACTDQILPDYVQNGLERVTESGLMEDDCPWSTFKTELESPRNSSVHCVFDEFDLFLVCDGHGGARVSQYCTANLNRILKRNVKASVEARYMELLQSEQKCKPASESTSAEAFDCLPERSARSASNLGEAPHPVPTPKPSRGPRRLGMSESVRIRGSTEFDSNKANRASLGTRPAAQCGLNVHHLHDCLTKSFRELDAEVKEQKLGDFEGSTALAVLVGSWHVCVASCGDSRAVLSRAGVAIRLTRDHKPHIAEERSRIEAQGGFVLDVYGCPRVNGFLAMSRAIGDHLITSVIAEPDVTVLHRHHTDEFLICATDGLWDVMTDDEACELTRKCLDRAEAKGVRDLSTRIAANVLLKAALDKGSTDNITVTVVDLRMNNTESKTDQDTERDV